VLNRLAHHAEVLGHAAPLLDDTLANTFGDMEPEVMKQHVTAAEAAVLQAVVAVLSIEGQLGSLEALADVRAAADADAGLPR
jgi:hypothetical protein